MKHKSSNNQEELSNIIEIAELAISELFEEVDIRRAIQDFKKEDLKTTNHKKKESKKEDSIEEQLRQSRERIKRLKDLSMQLHSGNIEELENIPAYKRKEINRPQFSRIAALSSNSLSFDNTFELFHSMTDLDVVDLARKGFPKSVLLSLAKKISLNIQELANILHISERTLQRYDDDDIIKTEYAEKAVELARLYTRGQDVFGSADKFKIWIKTPSHVFKGEAPVTILDTSAGFDMIFKELGRIEHGIFA